MTYKDDFEGVHEPASMCQCAYDIIYVGCETEGWADATSWALSLTTGVTFAVS